MHTDGATTPDSSESKTEEAPKRPQSGNKFLDFLLSIFGGAGNKVKSHAMAVMGGDGPGGANLLFYDRKLEDIWKKRKEQERERGTKQPTCFLPDSRQSLALSHSLRFLLPDLLPARLFAVFPPDSFLFRPPFPGDICKGRPRGNGMEFIQPCFNALCLCLCVWVLIFQLKLTSFRSCVIDITVKGNADSRVMPESNCRTST